jgi:lysophospholipase L1-like esterase
MNPRRKWLRYVGLPVVSVLATLAVAEFAIRSTPLGRPRLDLTPFLQYNLELGWSNRPFSRGTVYDREYATYLQYNSKGMRGPERSYAKPPGTYRILALGDSFVDGYTVALADRVTEQLERLLNAASPPQRVEAITMGVAGYSTDQELLWLESEGLRYEPDLVVLLFFDNDIYGNGLPYFFGAKPQFLWNGRALALHNVPVPHSVPGGHRHETSRWNLASRFPAFHRWAEDHSRLYRLAAGTSHSTPLPPHSPIYRRPETPEVRSAWEVTRALLARMKRDAGERGTGFLVFYIPRREDVYRQDWAKIEARLGLQPGQWDMRGVTDRFLEICREEDLHCLDPTARFVETARQLAPGGQRLYYKYDGHWAASGHRLAAQILAEQIRPELMKRAHLSRAFR